jgi:hypothetical protein
MGVQTCRQSGPGYRFAYPGYALRSLQTRNKFSKMAFVQINGTSLLQRDSAHQMPPQDGFTIAHFLTVADIERLARFYETVFFGIML